MSIAQWLNHNEKRLARKAMEAGLDWNTSCILVRLIVQKIRHLKPEDHVNDPDVLRFLYGQVDSEFITQQCDADPVMTTLAIYKVLADLTHLFRVDVPTVL